MKIGSNIKRIRKSQKLTQEELGEMSGIPQCVISFYERDNGLPALQNLCRIADALNVSLDELVGRRTT